MLQMGELEPAVVDWQPNLKPGTLTEEREGARST